MAQEATFPPGPTQTSPWGQGVGAAEVFLFVPWLGIQEPPPGSWEKCPAPTLPLGPECSPVDAPTSVSDHTTLLCLQELNCNYFSVTVAALFFMLTYSGCLPEPF